MNAESYDSFIVVEYHFLKVYQYSWCVEGYYGQCSLGMLTTVDQLR